MRSVRFQLVRPVLVAVAVLSAGCSSPAEPSTGGETSAVPSLPTSVAFESARSAAVSAVAMTGEVTAAGFASRPDLIRSFTTADFAPVLLDRTNQQLRDLAREFVGQGIGLSSLKAVETPLTASVVATDTGARATVWSVLVVVVADAGPARQMWRTVTLDLVPVDGTWRVDAWESVAGPTPLPLTEASFDDVQAFDGPLSWAAASTGGV